MKKIWIFFVMCLFLSACSIQLSAPGKDNLGGTSGNDISGEDSSGNDVSTEDSPWQDTLEELIMRDGDPSFLDHTHWESKVAKSSGRSLIFGEMGEFEQYIYTWADSKRVGIRGLYCADEMAYYILDEKNQLIDIGKIVYADDHYLVMDFWDLCRSYQKHYDYKFEFPHHIVHESAQTYVGIYHYTKPRLRIAGYEDGKISVFQCTYDSEEAANAKVWELNLSEDCEFESVVYSVASDTAEITTLEKSDYESVPEEYADGFFSFNEDGEVSSVVFYEDIWPSEEEKHIYEILKEYDAYKSDESFLDGTRWERKEGQGFGRSLYLDRFGKYRHSTYGENIDKEYIGELAYYIADEMAYYVLDDMDTLIDIGQIIYADDYYLVMDFWETCYAFYADKDYDVDFPHDIVPESAQKSVGIYEYTKPRLRIAEYGDGTVSVLQCTYDADQVDEAKVWDLKLSEDCEFKSVIYSVSSDAVKETVLEKSDYESVPSKYADGFFDFNADGEVCSVVFYSEVD